MSAFAWHIPARPHLELKLGPSFVLLLKFVHAYSDCAKLASSRHNLSLRLTYIGRVFIYLGYLVWCGTKGIMLHPENSLVVK